MNLLSDPLQPATYLRMEYCEAGEPFEADQPSDAAVETPSAAAAEMQSNEAILAARLEEEKLAIMAQCRADAEREIHRTRRAIAEATSEFARQREDYYLQVESEVVQLALAIARRIIHREAQIDPRLLAALVRYELEQLDAATSVRLVVSPDSLDYWNDSAPTMPRAVEVTADKSLASGTIRIQTALGSTSVNFEQELKEIERGFFDLLSHRPAQEERSAARVQ
jgi:flagellar assembly protein FliH